MNAQLAIKPKTKKQIEAERKLASFRHDKALSLEKHVQENMRNLNWSIIASGGAEPYMTATEVQRIVNNLEYQVALLKFQLEGMRKEYQKMSVQYYETKSELERESELNELYRKLWLDSSKSRD